MLINKATVGGSVLAAILRESRSAFIGVAAISIVINVLAVAGSIYMMLVYDSVLPSRSIPTLVSLLIMVTCVFAFSTGLEILRSRMLVQLAGTLDLGVSDRIHRLIGRLRLDAPPGMDNLQPVRDVDAVRAFLSGGGPAAMIDLPWILFYSAFLTLLHPYLGLTVLLGGLILVGLTYATERASRGPTQRAGAAASERLAAAESTRRHAEAIRALGMQTRMEHRWSELTFQSYLAQKQLTDVAGTLGGASRGFRLLLQSIMLSVGALLVIEGKATGGVIFASSILSARALAPVEQAIANWRGFIAARQSWMRLNDLMGRLPADPDRHLLEAPKATLAVESLVVGPPGNVRATVAGVSFEARAGEAVAVIGPSGSGKSTLVRAIAGVWRARQGAVRLDGAAIDQWDGDELGRHIGYLPQNVELMAGTIAQNIARFDTRATSAQVAAAARAAGAHELIVHLSDGYETEVGADGMFLSAGQRQRIALARAMFGNPFLLVLDEPNSNLDTDGDSALISAITRASRRGAITLIVAHRQSTLAAVNTILYLREGRVVAHGPRDEVLAKLAGQPSETHAPADEAEPQVGSQKLESLS